MRKNIETISKILRNIPHRMIFFFEKINGRIRYRFFKNIKNSVQFGVKKSF